MLDFKKEISSTHRIAKSIVSFANHYGGTLLVGVNDDGSIAGVKTAEETYMLEQAALHFCDPPIELEIKEWTLKGKVVLEVIISESTVKPHFAIDEQGKKWVYVRHKDQSLLASKVLVDVLKQKSSNEPVLLKYSNLDKALMDFLKQNPRITVQEYCKLVNISRRRAQRILVNLTAFGIIRLHDIEKPEYYTLL
jgi:predicted HTH transcriptional regulator